MPNYWSPLEIESLRATYLTYSLQELSAVSGRGKCGIVEKLGKLQRSDPSKWCLERIRIMRNEAHREYIKELRKDPGKWTHHRRLEGACRERKKFRIDIPRAIIKPCLSCHKPFEAQGKTNRICPSCSERETISPLEEFRRYRFKDLLEPTGDPLEPNYPKDTSELEDNFICI